jgi:hypothetical protein
MAQMALLISCGLSVMAKAEGVAQGDYFLLNNQPVRVAGVSGSAVRLTNGKLVSDADLTSAERLTAKPSAKFYVRRPIEKRDVSGTVEIFRIKNEMRTQDGLTVAYEVAGNGILMADFIDIDQIRPLDVIRSSDSISTVISSSPANDFVELSISSFALMLKEAEAQESYDLITRVVTLLAARGNFAGTQMAAYAELTHRAISSIPAAKALDDVLTHSRGSVDVDTATAGSTIEDAARKAARDAVRK